MNVRFSDRALRCRVSGEELQSLLTGRALRLEVALPRDHAFRLAVRPGAIGGWSLDSDPTGVWLTIPRSDLEALAESLPSRDGLSQTFDVANGGFVEVTFEVDVRRRS